MNIESIRDYSLTLPQVTEDFPFDETTLVFRVAGKIFAMIDLEQNQWLTLKCEPEYAQQLREHHAEIEGAWHMNKRHWISVILDGTMPQDELSALIRGSYRLTAPRIPSLSKN